MRAPHRPHAPTRALGARALTDTYETTHARFYQLVGPVSVAEANAFLDQYKPSAAVEVQTGWYWVRLPHDKKGKAAQKAAEEDERESDFLSEGAALVEKLTNRCAEIKVREPPVARRLFACYATVSPC